MRRLPAIAGLGLVAILAMGDAGAQQRRPAPPPPPKEEPAPEPPPAVYEPELLRLAEILGALGYLTTLCGTSGGEAWRQRMAQLIEAEGVTPQRRDRLAGATTADTSGISPRIATVPTGRARRSIASSSGASDSRGTSPAAIPGKAVRTPPFGGGVNLFVNVPSRGGDGPATVTA